MNILFIIFGLNVTAKIQYLITLQKVILIKIQKEIATDIVLTVTQALQQLKSHKHYLLQTVQLMDDHLKKKKT